MRVMYENYMGELRRNLENKELEFNNIKPADLAS